tara:strand:+ start:628 stop:909 length:282 start_codon:yes stop_codon:yes gene_type:complete
MQKQEKTIMRFPRATLAPECTLLIMQAIIISRLENNGRFVSVNEGTKKSPKTITRKATTKTMPISIKTFLGLKTVLVTSHDIIPAKKATKTMK